MCFSIVLKILLLTPVFFQLVRTDGIAQTVNIHTDFSGLQWDTEFSSFFDSKLLKEFGVDELILDDDNYAKNKEDSTEEAGFDAGNGEQSFQKIVSTVVGGSTVFQKIQTAFKLQSNIGNIEDLSRRIENCNTIETLVKCVDHHEKRLNFINGAWKATHGPSTAEMMQQLDGMSGYQEMNHFKLEYQANLARASRKMANVAMHWTVATSFFVIFTQAGQLFIIWNDIRTASNLVNDQAEKAKITDQLDRLRIDLTQLDSIIQNWRIKANGPKKEQAFNRVLREMNKLQRLQTQIFSAIDNMKFKIDGQITKLGNHQTTLAMNILSTGFHFTLTAVQLYSSYGMLGATAKGFGWAVLMLLGSLQGGNIATYVVTTQKVSELRGVIQRYKMVDLELTKMMERITELQEWADNLKFDGDNDIF